VRDSDDYQPPDPADRTFAEATAIAHCEFCDDDGMRGMRRCDHRTDYAAAAKRGMDLIRPILDKKGRK
jgi:hypothetical protein